MNSVGGHEGNDQAVLHHIAVARCRLSYEGEW